MSKIQILGEEIEIKFNMAVEIGYEELSNTSFNIDDLAKSRNTLILSLAAIIASNPDTSITFDRLLTEASAQEIAILNKAVVEAMTNWLSIPAVIAKEEAKEKQPDVNEKQKN